ncbi:MAG: hypothetical protein CSA81_10020 [Acidobacteria bacterium]|nr:MAG: hypothetical protein CSA81_10020 [Acidobacteriota bacterium]PIE90794.1 MAG: hypothetical protein CR997_03985 [Acidobacteriota bacterium]
MSGLIFHFSYGYSVNPDLKSRTKWQMKETAECVFRLSSNTPHATTIYFFLMYHLCFWLDGRLSHKRQLQSADSIHQQSDKVSRENRLPLSFFRFV